MLTHAHATLFTAVNNEIFINLWVLRAPRGTHYVARKSSSAAPKILPVRLWPSSQSICQVVCLVCDPVAISAGPSLSSGLPQTRHFPTQPTAVAHSTLWEFTTDEKYDSS